MLLGSLIGRQGTTVLRPPALTKAWGPMAKISELILVHWRRHRAAILLAVPQLACHRRRHPLQFADDLAETFASPAEFAQGVEGLQRTAQAHVPPPFSYCVLRRR